MGECAYNEVYTSIYEEDWSQAALLAAMIIFTKCTNQYGVYKIPTRTLYNAFAKYVPTADIKSGIDELITDGTIRLYKDGSVVWIRGKWRRSYHIKIKNNRVGAIRWVAENFPEVLEDFEEKYPTDAVIDYEDTVPTPSRHRTNAVPTTDTDTHSDTDSETKEEKTFPEDITNLVMKLFPEDATDARSLRIQCDSLDKLLRVDHSKLDPKNEYSDDQWRAEVFAVLEWAKFDEDANAPRGDWKGWGAVFHSIHRLRETRCEKYKNMRGSYLGSKRKGKAQKALSGFTPSYED